MLLFLVLILVNICIPNEWQPSPLKPSIQPYVQCPSCVLHIMLTHVSQWYSQLTPYLPVVHSEQKSKENDGSWHWHSVSVMVLNVTFNNISVASWPSVSFVEETGVPGENHRPAGSHWKLNHIMLCHTGIDTDYNTAYNTLRVPDIFVSDKQKSYISASFDIREAWKFNYQYKYTYNVLWCVTITVLFFLFRDTSSVITYALCN